MVVGRLNSIICRMLYFWVANVTIDWFLEDKYLPNRHFNIIKHGDNFATYLSMLGYNFTREENDKNLSCVVHISDTFHGESAYLVSASTHFYCKLNHLLNSTCVASHYKYWYSYTQYDFLKRTKRRYCRTLFVIIFIYMSHILQWSYVSQFRTQHAFMRSTTPIPSKSFCCVRRWTKEIPYQYLITHGEKTANLSQISEDTKSVKTYWSLTWVLNMRW